MRIKRLELVGFKSFVDPTVVDFDAPIVGIVGPNGCGKSNIVDALRWVMGEMSAKSLRGRAMEDVIFNGSDKRLPLGMCEVSLTFSTEDGIAPAEYAGFTEITITRRLFRSGESEYLINKVPARLRDIVDLFLGTGVGHKAYSIIEQGRIDFAINAKAEDRRLLIEEAAGVSKFKSRKEAALRRMESADQNLSRLRDILREVTRQISSLERQVRKAERYKVLKAGLRDGELRLASIHHHELSREIGELRDLLRDWDIRETASSTELAACEAELEKSRLEQVERDREYSSMQEKTYEVMSRLQLLDAQEGFRKKEAENFRQLREQALQKIEDMKTRLESVELESRDLASRRESLETDTGFSQAEMEKTAAFFHELEAESSALSCQLENRRNEKNQWSSEWTRLEGEKRFLEEKSVALRGQMARADVERDALLQRMAEENLQLQKKQESFGEVTLTGQTLAAEIDKLRQDAASVREKKDILSRELSLWQEELVMKRSRLKSLFDLERNFEGYEEGVRSILKAKKEARQMSGVVGVVAESLETSPQYELAVSAALGEKLQYVIVKSHEEGIEAVQYLKTQSTGRSSFIPMEVRDTEESVFPYEGHQGVVGPLLQQVQLKEGFQKIGQFLLGDVVLVQTLSDAISLWKSNGHKKTLVTMEGEVVDPSGVVSGGNTEIRGKILLEKKREIRELRVLVAEMEEDISLREDSVSQLEGNLSEIQMNLEEALQKSQEVEIRRRALETDLHHLEEAHRRLQADLKNKSEEKEAFVHESERIGTSLADLNEGQKALGETLARTDQSLQEVEASLRTLQVRVRETQETLTRMRIEAAALSERKALIEKEWTRLQQTGEDLRNRIQAEMLAITEANQKLNLLEKNASDALVEKETLTRISGEMTLAQEATRRDYEALTSSLQGREARVRELRKEYDLARKHTGDLRVTLSRAESEIHHLGVQMVEKYSVNLSEFPPPFGSPEEAAAFDRAAEETRVSELKEQVERLGDVNLGAIPEFEELRTRQSFLETQIQDLESSLEALRKAILKINQTTRKRFEETFALVNERFQTLFPRLFNGGRAELRLVVPEGEGSAVQNAGVELMVQPPGKKLSHVGLLSGGEKAMAAVAFVFSIFLVKPSPFCILDEVDAPLDDLNTTRFHMLLSEMVGRTQFILITHNRRSMEKADILYGVTMQEPGASQMVSVRLTDGLKLAS